MDPAKRVHFAELARHPGLFLRDIDPTRDAVVLSPMSEDSYRASVFLDNRLVRDGERDVGVAVDALRRMLVAQQAPRRRIHWLFHVGHCGSTLLSRLLGETAGLFALREPAVLMGLTRSARRLEEPDFPIDHERWTLLKDVTLTMLGRTWHPWQTALVKATSDAVNLAPTLLRFTGEERSILLYVDLATFVTTMLRPHTRRELQLFAREFRISDFRRLAPDAPKDPADSSDGRLAAVAWLLHVRAMAQVLDDPELAPRTFAVSFDDYLSAPAARLGAIAAFLGQPLPAATVETLLGSHAAGSYAKSPSGEAYDAGRREAELDAVRAEHGEEIADALEWAQGAVASTPVLEGLIERFSGASPPPAPR